MKRWWLYTISCVCNGIAATAVLILFIYNILTDNTGFSFVDGLAIFIFLLGYAIYLFSDIWGLKLYKRYKNLDSVSFTDKGKVQVLLVFLGLVQIFMGYLAYDTVRPYILHFTFTIENADTYWAIRHLTIVIFLTSIIVFIGFIMLLIAINKNKIIIKKEIENIGKTDF